jgi:hypothetical protein
MLTPTLRLPPKSRIAAGVAVIYQGKMIANLFISGVTLLAFSFFTGFFFVLVAGAGLALILVSWVLSLRSPDGLSGELEGRKEWFRYIAIAWGLIFTALMLRQYLNS